MFQLLLVARGYTHALSNGTNWIGSCMVDQQQLHRVQPRIRSVMGLADHRMKILRYARAKHWNHILRQHSRAEKLCFEAFRAATTARQQFQDKVETVLTAFDVPAPPSSQIIVSDSSALEPLKAGRRRMRVQLTSILMVVLFLLPRLNQLCVDLVSNCGFVGIHLMLADHCFNTLCILAYQVMSQNLMPYYLH